MCAIQTKNGILLTLQLSFPNAFLAGLISRHDELDEERKAWCSKINKKSHFQVYLWSNYAKETKIAIFGVKIEMRYFLLISDHCAKGSFLQMVIFFKRTMKNKW